MGAPYSTNTEQPQAQSQQVAEGAKAAPAPATATIAETTDTPETVEEARRKGWVPKEEYKGDPSKWVDATTFVERGERFVKNLQHEIADLRKQVSSFEDTKKSVKKFYEERIAQRDTELKEAITNLRMQHSQAIREGDDELAITAEDSLEKLKKQREELQEELKSQQKQDRNPGPTENDPVLLEWIEDGNQWFKDNPQLQSYAVKLGEQMIAGGETARGRIFLNKLSEAMKREFPRRFRQSQSPSSQAVEGNSPGTGHASGKSERDLPESDKKLMEQFVSEGWMTKEAFLQSYFSR